MNGMAVCVILSKISLRELEELALVAGSFFVVKRGILTVQLLGYSSGEEGLRIVKKRGKTRQPPNPKRKQRLSL